MIIGVMGDEHDDRMNATQLIVDEFIKRGVEIVFHTGDRTCGLNAGAFKGLPVVYALTRQNYKDGVLKEAFRAPPPGWTFTESGKRIYQLDQHKSIYIGHMLPFEFLLGSEGKLQEKMDRIRMENDCVELLLGGHTHHQIYKQGHLISLINPGAASADYSFDGHEFAIIDTNSREVVFSRIPEVRQEGKPFSFAVIGDSFDIRKSYPNFWQKLRKELDDRGATYVIHVGNIALCDVGCPEFDGIHVYYYLREDQKDPGCPANWHLVTAEDPVVEFEGIKFYVQLDLGVDLMEQSEIGMHKLCLGLRHRYPEIKYVCCGFTFDALLEKGEQVTIINPGAILKNRNFMVGHLPRQEFTFRRVSN